MTALLDDRLDDGIPGASCFPLLLEGEALQQDEAGWEFQRKKLL